MYFKGKVIILGSEVYNGYIYFENGVVRVPAKTEKTLPIEYQTFNVSFKSFSPYKITKITALDRQAFKDKNIKPVSPFKIHLIFIEGVFKRKEDIREGFLVLDLCNRIKMNIVHKRYWILKVNRLERSIIFFLSTIIIVLTGILLNKFFSKDVPNNLNHNIKGDTLHKPFKTPIPNTPVKP